MSKPQYSSSKEISISDSNNEKPLDKLVTMRIEYWNFFGAWNLRFGNY
jgi:hypothetical protein